MVTRDDAFDRREISRFARDFSGGRQRDSGSGYAAERELSEDMGRFRSFEALAFRKV
jgi:hypothetical protein